MFYDDSEEEAPIHCILEISGSIANLDYKDVKQSEADIDEGVLTIIFTDLKRNTVERIDWTAADGEINSDCALSNWHIIEDVIEGKRYLKEVELLYRDRFIVEKRKEKDDYTCQGCGYQLLVGNKYIVDCHHLDPLSNSAGCKTTAIEDLVTLCPNCHRIAHTETPPLTVKNIKSILNAANRNKLGNK